MFAARELARAYFLIRPIHSSIEQMHLVASRGQRSEKNEWCDVEQTTEPTTGRNGQTEKNTETRNKQGIIENRLISPVF